MEELQHDSHQFYFERYLRNKLTSKERLKLEDTLKNNEKLNRAFTEYKQNRSKFLKELIQEHDNGPKRNKLIAVFYLVITILGIFTVFNFYTENKLLKEESKQNKNIISRLTSRVPFLHRSNNKTDTLKVKLTDKIKNNQTTIKPTNIIIPDRITIEPEKKSIVALDTVLIPIKAEFYEEKLAMFRNEVDSTLTNSDIQKILLKNNDTYNIKYKSSPIAVIVEQIEKEQESNYQFDGLQLKIQTNKPIEYIFLVADQGEIIWLTESMEILLIGDNLPHKF